MDARERYAAVRQIAREGDADRYASTLFAPTGSRDHLFTLYAFNVELARIGEHVSEPELGEIRLQWWHEAIDRAAAGESTGHPVADAMGRTMRQCGLSRASVSSLIDARRFDLSMQIMPDMPALEDYLANTAGALFLLASQLTSAGGQRSEAAVVEPAAKAAGIAYGLTGLMRAMPVHAARGRIDLPSGALLRHGVSSARILAGETSAGLTELLAELRGKARAALGDALRHVAKLAPQARTAFLPLALVSPYLASLEKGDPLRRIAEIGPLHRLWRLATYRFRS